MPKTSSRFKEGRNLKDSGCCREEGTLISRKSEEEREGRAIMWSSESKEETGPVVRNS